MGENLFAFSSSVPISFNGRNGQTFDEYFLFFNSIFFVQVLRQLNPGTAKSLTTIFPILVTLGKQVISRKQCGSTLKSLVLATVAPMIV